MIATVDCRIPEDCLNTLRRFGYRVNTLPPMKGLPSPLASHTDMLIGRLGKNLVSFADYCDIAPYIFTDIMDGDKSYKIHFTADVPGEEYPRDARLNVLAMGDILFCKTESVSPYIIELARGQGYRTVDVKQGYPACTVLKLSEEAAITADRGMARVLSSNGIRVYTVENGGIALPPYEYGFIGGAAGVHQGKVYFLGDVGTHPSAEVIRTALATEGLTPVSLGRGGLVDLGGILFV